MKVSITETSWPQLQRLRFIERQLLWDREVTAGMLTGAFGLSRPEAMEEITTYTEIAPENVKPYDPSDRCYKPTRDFKPKLISDSADSLITVSKLASPTNPDFYSVPVLSRNTAPGTLAAILTAIEHRSCLEAMYVSMQTPQGSIRKLTPCAIISASNRLHVRAYCWDRQAYRDFVLSRFRTTPLLLADQTPVPHTDQAWDEILEVRLIVNPELNPAQQWLIEEDYDLKQLKPFLIRKALVGYFLQANLLPSSTSELNEARIHPQRFPLLPVNSPSGEAAEESIIGYAF